VEVPLSRLFESRGIQLRGYGLELFLFGYVAGLLFYVDYFSVVEAVMDLLEVFVLLFQPRSHKVAARRLREDTVDE
jgi:hypothetical protein